MRARWPHQSWVANPKPTSTEVTQSQLPVAMTLGMAKMKSEKHREMFP